MLLMFFFSSRRRHTRCYRDWSSDVCSSDLRFRRRSRCRCSRRSRPRRRQRQGRSEERRVGKEGRSRWSPYHLKKKKKEQLVIRIEKHPAEVTRRFVSAAAVE